MSKQYRVGVVGLGVGGATVSQLLAHAGHQVTLFERASQVGPIGAGILLQPSGQMVLQKLGLLERVAASSEPIEQLYARTHRGKTLIQLPYGEVYPGCRAYGLHRGDLFDVLYAEVQTAKVAVHLDHEIRSCEVNAGRVFLKDVYGRRHGPFDFVVAADGSRSTLRGDTRLQKKIHEYDYGAVWAIGRCSAIRQKLHQVVQGTKHLLGLLPMGQDRCSLFWSLHRGEKDAVWKKGFASWKSEVLRLCPEAEEIFQTITDFDQVAYTTYLHVWMRCWHDDHILFLGDAAHAMSPHLGQGINLAMIDAYCFAELLAQTNDYRQAFRRFVQTRRQHLRYYAFCTYILTPFFQSGGFIKGWGRDFALPILTRLPIIRRQMLMTMAGIKSGFLGGLWQL